MMTPNRRTFIEKGSLLAGVLLSGQAPLIVSKASASVAENVILGHGNYKYRLDRKWSAVDPIQAPVFNCHEMVMDSQGRLILLTDELKNNIIIFDRNGSLIDTWGTRWPGAHGLTLSKEGDKDYLFIVDCGWFYDFGGEEKWMKQAGTVTKTDLLGRVIFTIGHPQTIGVYDEGQPYLPTEVAVAPNGDFYVADGYGSDYILQYDHRGQFIRKFGGHDNADERLNLRNAHGVAVDLRDPNRPVLICTSRSENCFKVFTMEGQYLETIALPGAFVCRPVIHGQNLYAGVCWSKENGTGKRPSSSGFVTILDSKNQVVSNPGGSTPEYKDGALQPIYQTSDVFEHCHDVCVDNDENLYICQWNAKKVYPYKLERHG